MPPLEISEELEEELERLGRAFPGPSLAVQDAAHPVTATLSAPPAAARPVFVRATVTATFPPSYPTGGRAVLTLSDVRGVADADAAAMQARLDAAAARAAPGAPHVAAAFRDVVAFLEERNAPPPCSVCGGHFRAGGGAARGGDACVVLEPCLHAVHAGACWQAYYTRAVRERRKLEAQLTGALGSLEAERRAMDGWPKCPTCGDAFAAGPARAAVAQAFKT
jgi:hypothetical protein